MLTAQSLPSTLDAPKSTLSKAPDMETNQDSSDEEELEVIEVVEFMEDDEHEEDEEDKVVAGALDCQGEDAEQVYNDEDDNVEQEEEEELVEEVVSDEDDTLHNAVADNSSVYSGDDLGGDSTHVAISGHEQLSVERVDLERLKPKSPERSSPKPTLSSLEQVAVSDITTDSMETMVEPPKAEAQQVVNETATGPLVNKVQAPRTETLPSTMNTVDSNVLSEPLTSEGPRTQPVAEGCKKLVVEGAPTSPSNPKAPPSYSNLPVEPKLLAKAVAEVTETGTSSPLAWEKPAWTKKQLRPTPVGDAVKQGANLESPITHIRKTLSASSMSGFVKCTASPLASPQHSSPVAGTKSLEWQKPTWVAAKLRPTEKGVLVKTKGDLQRPITKVEKNGMDSINVEANPMGLRPTDRGSKVRLGATLSAPITHVGKSPMADVNFEANPDLILQPTELGEVVKQGNSLASPVTKINQEKSVARDVNFVANPAVLRKTELGEVVKKVGDLQAPITHVERDHMKDINFEANPMVLKPTDKGYKIRLGDDLSGPITKIASNKNPMADVNFEANPDLILQPTPLGQVVKKGNSLAKPVTNVNVEKDAARDVNFVANPAMLRKTGLGEIVKTKGDLQKPITHVEKDSLDDINFEANPMILRPTTKGCLLRIGEDLARPITHIARNRMAEIDEFQGSGSSGA